MIALMLCCLLLTGCTETPSEVLHEMSLLDQPQERQADPAPEPVPVAELGADAEAALQTQKGSFVLESADVPDVQTVCAYTLQRERQENLSERFQRAHRTLLGAPADPQRIQCNDFRDDPSVLTDAVFFGENTDRTEISALGLRYAPYSLSLERGIYEEAAPSLGLSAEGVCNFCRGFDGILSPYLNEEQHPVKETRYRGEWQDTAAEMYGGEQWRMADCAQYVAEQFAALGADPVFSYQPFSITVRGIGAQSGYWVAVQRVAPDGLPVYPYAPTVRTSDYAPDLHAYPLEDLSWCWCAKENEVQELHKAENYTLQDSREIGALLPLSAAKRIAEGALAKQRSYHVTARLSHVLKLCGSQVSAMTGSPFAEAAQYGDYTQITLEPYWVFTEQVSVGETLCLVNAQTGAFEIV